MPDDPTSSLFLAAMTGDTERAIAALDAGAPAASRNAHGLSPLHVVAGGVGPPALLTALLAAGVAVDSEDSEGWTALIYVASSGQLALLELLLAGGANPHHQARVRGWTALTRAAYRGQAGAVRLLLKAGARASDTTEGKTALEWAREMGHAEAVLALTE